ncbi:hypothetical protein DT075_07095 [Bacillus licheniformis]|nr:hypothetical protein DT075_07095 [Bacillus licheniformis]
MTLADLLSRLINYPFETPIEVVTSVIGVPFFLYLIKRKGGEQRASGIILALSLSKKVTALSLGDDISESLGQKKQAVKWTAMAAVVVLTGCSVAMAGKIAFVGLVVPHITHASVIPNGFMPVQLAIIGTVTSMLLSSLSAAISIYFQISQDVSFWYSARLHQLNPELLKYAVPFFVKALAVSGALMQGVTRNYLASPSIMGVSDGSAFVITLLMVVIPGSSSLEMMGYSFIGSAVGAGLVFGRMTRIIMIAAPFAILLSVFLSVCYGAKQLEPEVIFSALLHFDTGNTDHQIIWHSRLPRAVGALLIGVCAERSREKSNLEKHFCSEK